MGVELSDRGIVRGRHRVINVAPGTGKTRTMASFLKGLGNEVKTVHVVDAHRLAEVSAAVLDVGVEKSLVGFVKGETIELQTSPFVGDLPNPEGANQTTSSVSVESNQTTEVAERLLRVLLHKKDREVVIGDLFEKYGTEVERRGKRRASLWLYSEVARSVWPLIRRLVVRVSGRIIRTRRAE